MTTALTAGETVRAEVTVRATAEQVYALVSDVTRYPQWSPECVEATWTQGRERFTGRNRRRLGRWTTHARVVAADPGREFSFVVESFGGDFTRWTYAIAPGAEPGTVTLSEEMRMCVDLPRVALYFERVLLLVTDRRRDLHDNLTRSLEAIRAIAEGR